VFIGITTLFCSWSRYPSLLLKSTAMSTIVKNLCTYVLPILYYGLEILLPTGKILEQLNIHYKKVLKQILSLYINVADPTIYILSGLLPIEAEIHIKVLTFL
jgi:hypothetical protein